MIKVVLLSVTLLLVNSAPHKQHLILEDVIRKLNAAIPEDLQNERVPNIFEKGKCPKQYFCQVQAVLKEIKHDFMQKWNINRALQAYHNVTECYINKNGNELRLKEFLIQAQHCAQQLYANPSVLPHR